MKILINRTVALRQKAGMGHYVSHLVRCLSARFGGAQLSLFPGVWAQSGLGGLRMLGRALGRIKGTFTGGNQAPENNPEAAKAEAKGFSKDWANSWARRLQTWHYETFWAHGDFDLYHEPNYIPFPCDRPTIITVADLSALLHPEWHPAERARHFAKNFLRGLDQSAHVLTISEFSRQEILRNLPVPPERVSCTLMGVRAGLRPLSPETVLPVVRRLGIPENFLLHVGTLEPRKNLLMLLKAYTDLPRAVREQSPLVLVGEWGWNSADLKDFYLRQGRRLGVFHLGYVSDADLPALYNGARALVFPSHYEGFGLPPLEMMACGGAVLASTAGAVVETVGSRAHLLDPLDQDAWQQAMQRVIVDDDWRQGLRQGTGAVAEPYTWERCAEATWDAYTRVLGRCKPESRREGLRLVRSADAVADKRTVQQGSEARP
jgi:alpha-1,3-rhamnosyl/mannosyltransferase